MFKSGDLAVVKERIDAFGNKDYATLLHKFGYKIDGQDIYVELLEKPPCVLVLEKDKSRSKYYGAVDYYKVLYNGRKYWVRSIYMTKIS